MHIHLFSAYLCTLQCLLYFSISLWRHYHTHTNKQMQTLWRAFVLFLLQFLFGRILVTSFGELVVSAFATPSFQYLVTSVILTNSFLQRYLCYVGTTSSAFSSKNICVHFLSTCKNRPTTLLKVTLLHGCFPRILHYTNGTTSRWALHMFICVPMFFVSVCDTTEC